MIIFKGKHHILITAILYITILNITPLILNKHTLISIPFIILGTLLPDIDYPYSTLGKYNMFSYLIYKKCKHRGIFHTIPAALIVSVTTFILTLYFNLTIAITSALAILFGYLSHLLADTLTPTGIMWLYPYKTKYYTICNTISPHRH